ncbi:MAG: ubiquinol-cytochrome c reductase iron-sulfur subunit [Dehalococcoidia bacterium]
MPDETPNTEEQSAGAPAEAQPAPAEAKAVERPARTPAVRAGGPVAAGAGGHAVVVARPAPVGPALPPISRRKLMLVAFWTGMTGLLASIVATTLNNLWPRGEQKLSGRFVIGSMSGGAVTIEGQELAPGEKRDLVVLIPNERSPLDNIEAKIYMVRFDEEQAARNPGAQAGAVLALWRKCPHLGCTVPFNAGYPFKDPLINATYQGWFKCPCHGSTYSDSGRRVFGPAPRSMDAFALTLDDEGNLEVDLDTVYTSITGNAEKALLPPA